jgi:hypothetical protein
MMGKSVIVGNGGCDSLWQIVAAPADSGLAVAERQNLALTV